MSNEPLVSIAVNNYNYGRFLQDAIDSALNQSYPHVEVIVVDDGSTDDSRDVIAGYGDRVVSVLKENGGQASAYNAAFAVCKGEIVIFLDADDALLPETARRVVNAWRPGLAKVQYLLEVVDADGRGEGKLFPTEHSMPSGDLRESILSSGVYLCSPTSGNAVSRHVLAELLPMPEKEWRISADGYLANLVPFFGDVLSLHEKLGYYRIHGSNGWAMWEMDLQKIRRYLAHDVQKQELLKEFGERMSFEVDNDLALRTPAHVKFRIASLRLDPKRHPYPNDGRWSLALRGISSCWRNSESSLQKKAFYSAWFALVALLPKGSAVESLIAGGLMPAQRPRFMRFMSATSVEG